VACHHLQAERKTAERLTGTNVKLDLHPASNNRYFGGLIRIRQAAPGVSGRSCVGPIDRVRESSMILGAGNGLCLLAVALAATPLYFLIMTELPNS
jgi:hypothetical protein